MGLMDRIAADPFEGFLEQSIAYNSLSVFYDPLVVYRRYGQSPQEWVTNWLSGLASQFSETGQVHTGREHTIPVCYEWPFAPDLDAVAAYHGVTADEIVAGHHHQPYYVFMVGFSPGFPYLGILPPFMETPRKSSPSLQVRAGSVGLAGRQTGIYPFDSPGGWNIIGRTPLRLFTINEAELCLLRPGDTVRFSPIDKQTFYYLNQYADT